MLTATMNRQIDREKAEARNRISAQGRGSGFRRSAIPKHDPEELRRLARIQARPSGSRTLRVCPECGSIQGKRRRGTCVHCAMKGEAEPRAFITQRAFEDAAAIERKKEEAARAVEAAEQARHPKRIALPDNKGFVSNAMGCGRGQVAHFNGLYGGPGSGVKFLQNGKAKFKNRAAKLKHMKARGMVDHDEVRGGRSR